jgi:Domain of unknown function (DUF397)
MPGHVVRDDAEDSGHKWRKSSRSYGSGSCVEVSAPSERRIAVRDSKNVQGAVLSFSPAQWSAFVAGVRSGKFGRVRRVKREVQEPKASTAPARSSASRSGVAMGTVSLQAVGPVVVGIARLASVYGCSVLLSSLSYA